MPEFSVGNGSQRKTLSINLTLIIFLFRDNVPKWRCSPIAVASKYNLTPSLPQSWITVADPPYPAAGSATESLWKISFLFHLFTGGWATEWIGIWSVWPIQTNDKDKQRDAPERAQYADARYSFLCKFRLNWKLSKVEFRVNLNSCWGRGKTESDLGSLKI